ncbi:ATP-dependent RNA helicase dbp10 [Tulasnella sp. 330]|nr:ATP-dependent RNA helicase dbp10 [Tulasnella sp. 330]KAG8882710.1 ATP-dependent RNA helicase dbp10 [Tulasnella sp. 331]KAG8888226.1 ATP-dependent RNA helicase dbp10 [Tulasnella sp. 332]
MPRQKRKPDSDSEDDEYNFISDNLPTQLGRAETLDIFNSLVGPSTEKTKKAETVVEDATREDEDDLELIQAQMGKWNVKSGMAVVKELGKGVGSKGVSGGGSFQSMGLNPSLLRTLLMKGFKIPTPIQRLAIPALLSTPPRDLVGMARTGSGKTLAYMVPLLQRLGCQHGIAFGARALILIPTRELALQVLKVGRDLARGWNSSGRYHAGEGNGDEDAVGLNGKPKGLRWGLIVGGESLNEQFEVIANNPDIIIATPGRLLHLAVEMELELKTVQYVVFDEADRLFELGFDTALHEILQRLPPTRQTLLFSATLPKNLVEFAQAGLQDPKLVRLDSESKLSSDLRMAFFSVKQAEKDACLLTLLRDVIRVPPRKERSEKKKPKKLREGLVHLAAHQTLIFAATKHHVEYLHNLLTIAGYSVSHIYGSLDQRARTEQMDAFRDGTSDILVVTDVAARGIDIPVLENVVNYDFPHGSRVFIHRVGRTARAGRQGWAWSFVSNAELPCLLDLQLFLGRELKITAELSDGEVPFTEHLILGTFPRDVLDDEIERVQTLDNSHNHLPTLREVMIRGHGLYERTVAKASQPSYARAKEMMKDGAWGLAGSPGESAVVHPAITLRGARSSFGKRASEKPVEEEEKAKARQEMLQMVNTFRPHETVFEVGAKGKSSGALLMKERRKALVKAVERAPVRTLAKPNFGDNTCIAPTPTLEMADDAEIRAAFASTSKPPNFRDSDYYLSYRQRNAESDKGYSLKDGASFAQNAQSVTFDLGTDEKLTGRQRHGSQLHWDKKNKKFVKGTGEGADNVKMIKTENGTKLPASYRSGLFDKWKLKNRTKLPRAGEQELSGQGQAGGSSAGGSGGSRFFKHKSQTEAKPLDPKHVNYERKFRQQTKKIANAQGDGSEGGPPKLPKKGARFGGKPMSHIKSELRSAAVIRKDRKSKEKRRARTGRPAKKGKGRGR